MKNVQNVQKNDLVAKTAAELKKIPEIKPPEWADYVKTGTQKQRPPSQDDWWYSRAASVLIKTLKLGPIGISKLRVKYGGKKRRGHKPAEFRKASGNILRKIVQQLEKAQLLKKAEVTGHKGRVVAPKGISLLDSVAKTAAKKESVPKVSSEKPKADAAEKQAAKKPEAAVKADE